MTENISSHEPVSKRSLVIFLMMLMFYLNSVAFAENTRNIELTDHQKEVLAATSKIQVETTLLDGTIHSGSAGIAIDDQTSEQKVMICTVTHVPFPYELIKESQAVSASDIPLGYVSKFYVNSKDNNTGWSMRTRIFQQQGSLLENFVSDPAICTEMRHMNILEERGIATIKDLPEIVYEWRPEMGQEVIIFDAEKIPITFNVTGVTENGEIQLQTSITREHIPLSGGDSGSLVLSQDNEGNLIAVGVYVQNKIDPTRDGPTYTFEIKPFTSNKVSNHENLAKTTRTS